MRARAGDGDGEGGEGDDRGGDEGGVGEGSGSGAGDGEGGGGVTDAGGGVAGTVPADTPWACAGTLLGRAFFAGARFGTLEERARVGAPFAIVALTVVHTRHAPRA